MEPIEGHADVSLPEKVTLAFVPTGYLGGHGVDLGGAAGAGGQVVDGGEEFHALGVLEPDDGLLDGVPCPVNATSSAVAWATSRIVSAETSRSARAPIVPPPLPVMLAQLWSANGRVPSARTPAEMAAGDGAALASAACSSPEVIEYERSSVRCVGRFTGSSFGGTGQCLTGSVLPQGQERAP